MNSVKLYNIFFFLFFFLRELVPLFGSHYYSRFIYFCLFIKNFSLIYSHFPKCLGSELIISFPFCVSENSSLERACVFFQDKCVGFGSWGGVEGWRQGYCSCPLGETKAGGKSSGIVVGENPYVEN